MVKQTGPAAASAGTPDLDAISAATLDDYDRRADDFWAGTRDHDVSQNIQALLHHMEGRPPLTILDFGCGPGRDLRTFAGLGHRAIGLEGSVRFTAMARQYSGCDVLQQDFLKLDLPAAAFDGVFANASLQHIPARELPRVLREIHAALKPGGILFASIPHGANQEGWNRGRYSVYHHPDSWRTQLAAAGFSELCHFYRPAGMPREQQPWLAGVWRACHE